MSLLPSHQRKFYRSKPGNNGYIVIRSLNSSLSGHPVDGTNYNIGDDLGDGTAISFGTSTSFNTTSLSPSITYYQENVSPPICVLRV